MVDTTDFRFRGSLSGLLLLVATALGLGESPAISDADDRLLSKAGIPTDDAGLRSFIRKTLPTGLSKESVNVLVLQLGSPKFSERELATKKLIDCGPILLEPLANFLPTTDAETARRLRYCIEQIRELHRGNTHNLVRAAFRIIAARNPRGTQALLIESLPAAALHVQVRVDAWLALDAVAATKEELEADIVTALKDANSERRAAAGFLSGRYGRKEEQEQAVKRLQDSIPLVRLRTAQGLIARKNWRAIPVLIDLVGEPDLEVAWQAEELLAWIARGRGPRLSKLTPETEPRKQLAAAWQVWWKTAQDSIKSLPHETEPTYPGLLLVQYWNSYYLLSLTGEIRWKHDTTLGNTLRFSSNQPLSWLNGWLRVMESTPAVTTRDGELAPVFWSTFDRLVFRWDSKRERVAIWNPDGKMQTDIPLGGLLLQYGLPVFELARIGIAPTSLGRHAWIEHRLTSLKSRNHSVRLHSLIALKDDFPQVRGSIPAQSAFDALLANATDAEAPLQKSVQFEESLTALFEKSKPSLGDLVRERLSDSETEVRALAVSLIPRLANEKTLSRDSSALSLVLAALKDHESIVRREAIDALIALDTLPERKVGPLISALTDVDRPEAGTSFRRKNTSAPERAAKGLGYLAIRYPNLGPKLAKAIPAIIKLVRGGNEQVQGVALTALTELAKGNESTITDVVPVYRNVIRDRKSPKLRERAAMDIGLFGANASPAAPDLITLWNDQGVNASTRTAVLIGLHGIGEGARDAVPLLIELLNSSMNEREIIQALEILARIGPAAKEAVPVLAQKSPTWRARVRAYAADTIHKIEPK